MDITVSCALLCVLSPVLGVVAVCVRISLGSPVLFRQWRPGRGERIFSLIKFRSMRSIGDGRSADDTDAGRLTSLGRVLRLTSLDELPELVNVIKGDMSLVGPRPLMVEYLALYSDEQSRRHNVRPGVTGWAQVNGRNEITWSEKFELDVWYVENMSLSLDVRILGSTALAVLWRRGVNSEGEATTTPFTG